MREQLTAVCERLPGAAQSGGQGEAGSERRSASAQEPCARLEPQEARKEGEPPAEVLQEAAAGAAVGDEDRASQEHSGAEQADDDDPEQRSGEAIRVAPEVRNDRRGPEHDEQQEGQGNDAAELPEGAEEGAPERVADLLGNGYLPFDVTVDGGILTPTNIPYLIVIPVDR